MNAPTTLFDPVKARDAFEAHSALLKTERDHPELRRNPHWTLLKQDAYERFDAAFWSP